MTQSLASDIPELSSDSELDVFIDEVMEACMEEHKVRGAAVSIVKNGQIIFAKGYGYLDARGTREIDAERTLFRIASVSKLFIATAVMQLVEQRRLSLDADVNTYLDGTGIHIPGTFDEVVTLRHLLSHTAGFEDIGQGYYIDKKGYKKSLVEFLSDYLPARIRKPGELSSYSNWSMSLAAVIVANVSGISYYDYIRENIFAPLTMTRTTSAEPPEGPLLDDLANGVYFRDGHFEDGFFETIFSPSGAVSSTVVDMAKFMLAHLQGGVYGQKQVLQAETVAQMHSRLFSAHQRFPGMAHGFIEREVNGRRLIGHHGVTRWSRTLLVLYPEEKMGMFIAANGAGGAALAFELNKALFDRSYPVALHAIKGRVDFSERARSYQGFYRNSRHNMTTLAKIDSLFSTEIKVSSDGDEALIVSSPAGPHRYLEIAPHLFRQVEKEDRIAFAVGDNDRIQYLYVWENSTKPLYKISYWETGRIQLSILAVCMLIFAGSICYRLVRWRQFLAMKGSEYMSELITLLQCIAFILFATGFYFALHTDGASYDQVWPGSIYITLIFPVLAVILSLPGLYYQYSCWAHSDGSIMTRVRNLLLLMTSLLFLFLLNYWNALGWKL